MDYNDTDWGTIPVPGMWELNGYNDPIYLNVGFAWRGHYENNPPYPPTEHNYVGQYRRMFNVDKSWIGKQICLCIGSATSNVRVWVNGKMVARLAADGLWLSDMLGTNELTATERESLRTQLLQLSEKEPG